MTLNRFLAMFCGFFISIMSLHSQAANYEYIYTSNPFHTVTSNYPSGSGPESEIDTNEFFQIKILSNIQFPDGNVFSTEGFLSNATFEFTLNGINHLFRSPGLKDDAFVDTQISIDKIDVNGLPTSWYISTQELDLNRDLPVRESIFIRSDNGINIFGKSILTQDYNYSVTAESNGGQWQFINNVPVSTVPEPSEFMMLIAGLGMMGFVARRKDKISS